MIRRLIRNVCFILILIWGIYAVLVGICSQLINLEAVKYGALITPRLMLAVGATSLTCPIAVFLHSSFLLLRRSRVMILAWTIAFITYLSTMIFVGDTVTGAIVAIAVGASSAVIIFSASLFRISNALNPLMQS